MNNCLTIAFMNICGQTGLDESKQLQIESFIKSYKVDILQCQEIDISDDSFSNCNFITSNYEILENNAVNKYGTCSIVSNSLVTENVKSDTNGRIICFDIGQMTFCNVYLPSGTDSYMKNNRENYISEILPQILINSKNLGCVGGDWNCISNILDATKNQSSKISNSLKRLTSVFDWADSFRSIHPNLKHYSRYYSNSVHGEGASRIDRMYHFGDLSIIKADYVGVAFSDHMSLVVQIQLPDTVSKVVSPKHKPLFKARPEVISDPVFQKRLKENFAFWLEVKQSTSLNIIDWWEIIVKPLTKKLLIDRSREINRERFGELSLLQIRQSYLVKKIQSGLMSFLAELHFVQSKIVQWHKVACDKVKLQSRCDELNSSENVRLYHHELHKKQIKRSSILKLQTESNVYVGHSECAAYLEQSVSRLLLQPPDLNEMAQHQLLKEVKPVFTKEDNENFSKIPSKEEVKYSVASSNLHAAPGTDGLTSYFYLFCWDLIGDSLTEMVQSVHKGNSPSLSQRTSLMVFGSKPKKPNSTKPSDKRKISLLNADFKIITGIMNERLKKMATHTLSDCQLAVGSDRLIHHGINLARDAIVAAGQRSEGVGILDNDYMAAFDHMVLLWVIKVLKAKGLNEQAVKHILNLYSNNFTIVVVNNVLGKRFENKHWSIRQGDRPSSILFCYGIDPHLVWLENRLRGIKIYSRPVPGPVLAHETFPPVVSEIFKVIGYIDDIKPAITSMNEFSVVDYGSSLFEKASGCLLHRDPSSGKVKFLPLGRWRGTLNKEDIPVNYIVLSDHLDMIGVELRATPTQTRKANGDILIDRTKKVIGSWKGGKFLPFSLRCLSVNTYCLSKVWFRCGSIDIRQGDHSSITSSIKSWVYADLLIKPEEIVLYKSRKEGGLSLLNVKFRAIAELLKKFIDTSINPKFKRNIFHQALFDWHVMGRRDFPNPGKSPYYSEEFFSVIRDVKEEGLLRLSGMSLRDWYKVLIEKYIFKSSNEENLSKCELRNPQVDWSQTWSLVMHKCLDSDDQSFLLRLLHGLLPSQERISKVLGKNHGDGKCGMCTSNEEGSLVHALLLCGLLVCGCVRRKLPTVTPCQLLHLDFGNSLSFDCLVPITWIVSRTLSIIWYARHSKKPVTVTSTRAALEASIMLLRKTRHVSLASQIAELVGIN